MLTPHPEIIKQHNAGRALAGLILEVFRPQPNHPISNFDVKQAAKKKAISIKPTPRTTKPTVHQKNKPPQTKTHNKKSKQPKLYFAGHRARVTLDPMPNTEVKPQSFTKFYTAKKTKPTLYL
jgi:hypothetical protein